MQGWSVQISASYQQISSHENPLQNETKEKRGQFRQREKKSKFEVADL